MRTRKSKRIELLILGVFVAVFLFTFLVQKSRINDDVSAASLANFDPGYIISDYQMGNYNSMSEADIQRFLTAKNPCANSNYSYYLSLSSNTKYWWHWADGHFVCLSEERFGDGEVIGSGDTAAHIIWQAAQDYRINPQALIVLLQKESSLITDPIPNNGDYRKATGYGCPDTAACSSKYYGFKNQVRNAAALFRTVLDGGWTNYPLGNNYIQYNPNAACGGSIVNIRSRATSALYRYTPYQPNAGALAAGYGTASCGAYGNRNFYLFFQDWFGGITDEGWPSIYDIMTHNRVPDEATDLDLIYQPHIQHYGWTDWVNGGAMAGTSGYKLRLEAFGIRLSNGESGIEYRTHIQSKGWEPTYKHDGETTGTVGEGLRVEAIQIRLTGDLAKRYDVLYRTHVQEIGWTGWSKNDEVSGTTGQGKRVEAMQIKLVKKNLGNGPKYTAHIQSYGWSGWVENAALAGTTGQGKRMEAIKISLPNGLATKGDIQYDSHIQSYGWTGWNSNGQLSGTTGEAKRMEAIKIKLTGNLTNEYDVFYRAHVQNDGWQKWVKNGQEAGTTGQAKRMEAIEIELVKK